MVLSFLNYNISDYKYCFITYINYCLHPILEMIIISLIEFSQKFFFQFTITVEERCLRCHFPLCHRNVPQDLIPRL
jgi:hypothetical protein